MKNTTIGLSMIVRNEEATLARCLESVQGLVDEIVVVDTGSSDRTVEIARRYTGNVFSFPWSGDFSEARNFALDKTLSRWVLYLDADEELEASRGDIRSLLEGSGDVEAFFLPLLNRDEISGNYSRYMVLRLFRNSPGHRFLGRIHEQVTISRPDSVGIADSPVIRHNPVSERDRNRKRGRNLHLLRQAVGSDPDNPFLQYYLGIEWLGLGRPHLALPCLQSACRHLSDGHLLFRAPAVLSLINCLTYLGRLPEAFCLCMEESLRYPLYTDLYFQGGLLLEQLEEYEAAARWFSEALACGQPPLLYSHVAGTESYLALHHLGHCHEKMRMMEKARDYYSQSVESNPDYVYPLSNLLLIYLAGLGPARAFGRVREEGHLAFPKRAQILADLFFLSGYPDLACGCLEESPEDSIASQKHLALRLARYRIYSGRAGDALLMLDELGPELGKDSQDLAADEIVALLMTGRHGLARSRALDMWRRPEMRGMSWGLLNLVSLTSDNSWSGYPEERLEEAATGVLLTVLDRCMKPFPACDGEGRGCQPGVRAKVAQKSMEVLARMSPRSFRALWDYLETRSGEVKQALDSKFAPAGRLLQ